MTVSPRRHRLAAAAAALILGGAAAPATAEPADAVRYPYVAAISRVTGSERVYFCAGTLVAPQWILTAAHCFHSRSGERISNRDVWAAVGRDRLGEAEEAAQVHVDRIVVHPDYDRGSQRNDLALVRLDQIAGPLIAEATAPPPSPEPGGATVLGFGSFFEGQLAGRALSATGAPAAQTSDQLRRTAIRLVDPAYCAARLGLADDGGTDRLCGTAAAEEACIGDSGGPLVAERPDAFDRLLGVVSIGSGCAEPHPVVVYTRVDAFSGWIAATLAPP